MINKACPDEYKYVGDGLVILGGLCPDFININGKKKVIEGYGNYWHGVEVAQTWNRTELGRIMTYNSIGFDCLIIWQSEIVDTSEEELISRIIKFNKEIASVINNLN